MDDELELAELGARLAVDAGLVDRITAIVARARGNTPDSLPPDIDTLLSTDDPNWPRDAVLFVLVTWLRFGLRELLEGFAVLEDSNPFDGKFKLADLLRIAGLDVSLDDQTAASLKTVFAETTATAGARAGG